MEDSPADREQIPPFPTRSKQEAEIQNPSRWWRLFAGGVAIAIALILWKVTPVTHWLTPSNLRSLKEHLGIWAPVGYIALYSLATIFAVPGTILTLSGGVLFGLFLGTLWTAIGATLGATGAFLVARFVAGDWARRQFAQGERWHQLSQGIREEGFWFALSIRLAPIFPFIAVNYLLGLTPISLSVYVLVTAIGILPGTFAYTWLGTSGLAAASGSSPWQLVGALTALAVLSALPLVLKRRKT